MRRDGEASDTPELKGSFPKTLFMVFETERDDAGRIGSLSGHCGATACVLNNTINIFSETVNITDN